MATNAVIGRNLLTAPDVHQVVPEHLAGSFVLGKSARTNVCLTLERLQGEELVSKPEYSYRLFYFLLRPTLTSQKYCRRAFQRERPNWSKKGSGRRCPV
jgi:hypothetical protein